MRINRRAVAVVLAFGTGLFWALAPALAAPADFFDRRLTWPKRPIRVVSLSPATTEMVYALGAQDQVLATTTDCNYPPAAARKLHVGKFGVVDTESLVMLHPDLVLATRDMAPKLGGLRHLTCPVLAVDTPSLIGIARAVETVGQALGVPERAVRWRTPWLARLAAVRADRLPKAPSVFFVLWPDPLMTATDASFIGDLIRQAGGRNVAPVMANPFPVFSWEALVAARPDWLLHTSSLSPQALTQGRWASLSPVRARRTIRLERDLVERSGPRSMDALETLHAALKRTRPGL